MQTAKYIYTIQLIKCKTTGIKMKSSKYFLIEL